MTTILTGSRFKRLGGHLALCLFAFSVSTLPARPQGTPQPAASAERAPGSESTPEAQSPEKNKQEKDGNEAYKHSAVVQALGAKLGLTTDQAATAFEVLNFVVLAALVGWFLAKALPKAFQDRTSSIQRKLVEARAATEEAGARLNSVEDRLGELDAKIAGLKAQAESDLALEETRARAEIEEARRKILAAAEQEISTATAQARRQIQQYAAELAVDQAAKKLVVSSETDRLLVQEFTNRLAGRRGEQN